MALKEAASIREPGKIEMYGNVLCDQDSIVIQGIY